MDRHWGHNQYSQLTSQQLASLRDVTGNIQSEERKATGKSDDFRVCEWETQQNGNTKANTVTRN
jgi:hypothetical protein